MQFIFTEADKERNMLMKWNQLYYIDKMPDFEDIERHIGEGALLWRELLSYIEKVYEVEPKMAYSKCAAQPGWNVKYQKSGKSLCTLYPMEGFFIALIVIGTKEETEVELASELELFTPYVTDLYRKTASSCGGRWLMVEVKDKTTLEDVKNLIAIRVKPKIHI